MALHNTPRHSHGVFGWRKQKQKQRNSQWFLRFIMSRRLYFGLWCKIYNCNWHDLIRDPIRDLSVIRSDPWSGPWSDPVRSRFCWSRFEAKCLMLLTTTWLTWVKNIEWWLLIFLAWQNNVMQKAACDDTIISNISSVTHEGLMDKFAVLVFIIITFAMLTFLTKRM